MRLATFNGARLGIVDNDELTDITDLAGVADSGKGGPLLALLEAGKTVQDLAAMDFSAAPRIPLTEATISAPLPRPHKVIGAPVNYIDHQIEMSEQKTIGEYGVFLKSPSSVIGPGESIQLPYLDKRTDQEGELGVVIGKLARNVSVDQALDYVFGYMPVLDITVRSGEDRSTRKSFRTFTPTGPYVVTADEVGDPDDLQLKCWVGGELRQQVNTRELIFSIAEVISYASHVMDLEPGDIIASGTPAGVGPLADGDDVILEIEKLGRLAVVVSAGTAINYADRPGPRLAADTVR
ncbi:fumarylacetoacetate hydrolase family protein [Paeniglutamicibacter gangotriensis]|uniref:5-carboxymethyl-2-hydroxymuconate delta-isomerase n=1 Tax=Paeniglutamicibacter gangotriensis Lz1y TaxID=1276920 RepID=M7MNW7_9MICC|nr:fumarylacetoacetate hydrolase family protein [Paeniglutamicibacter gangotriensis]EMQ96716.1 5-carboxymethyl-2-hydroxymuconate delta-isomerase [Paeniglutamicibacter gangotriensis Lz1y]